jgi:hypothetical protein
VPDLASTIGYDNVLDSMATALVRASPPPPSTDPVTLLLLIGVSAVALAAVIHIIVGVVMTFKIWIKSFIATTLRIGYCTACLVKILTAMSAGFLWPYPGQDPLRHRRRHQVGRALYWYPTPTPR